MTNESATYLGVYLTPLADFLKQKDVTDLYINRPGELWVERLGHAPERYVVPTLSESLLWRLAKQVASLTHQGISREHPLLSARLPDGSRIQIVAPPATRGPIAMAIRKHVIADLTLDDYHDSGALSRVGVNDNSAGRDDQLLKLHHSGDWRGFLRLAVRERLTILISGGTSSGKTTFLNALMREIGSDERIILIEDTPEVSLQHPNAAGLVAVRGELGEAQVTTNDLLTATLRMRPDRIIVGELRGPEAFTFLRAANTGHPGSMTTIHANNAAGAIDQLAMLSNATSPLFDKSDTARYAEAVIDVVIQLTRAGGKRSISEIVLRTR